MVVRIGAEQLVRGRAHRTKAVFRASSKALEVAGVTYSRYWVNRGSNLKYRKYEGCRRRTPIETARVVKHEVIDNMVERQ
jgi:hypothetical protein